MKWLRAFRLTSAVVFVQLSLVGLYLFPETAFAADSVQPSPSPAPAGGVLLLWIICYLARKKSIGGWLLFYFVSLYLALLVRMIEIIPPISSYGPEAFEGRAEYIVFLLTTVPLDLILFTQVLLSFWLFSYDKRKWLYVEMLKKVLLTGIIIAVGSIPIDAMLWPENIFFDTYPAVFWLVWFLYFKKSARVRIVFKERHWDWNTFHKRSNVQQTGQSPE